MTEGRTPSSDDQRCACVIDGVRCWMVAERGRFCPTCADAHQKMTPARAGANFSHQLPAEGAP